MQLSGTQAQQGWGYDFVVIIHGSFLQAPKGKGQGAKTKTYNTEDSQVVTDPSTNSALSSLSMGERTGSRVFWKLWSYVMEESTVIVYIVYEIFGFLSN